PSLSKRCMPFFKPPISWLSPTTRSKVVKMDPINDAFTISNWPERNNARSRIKSTALPKLALSSAPTFGPVSHANTSVDSARRAAKGIKPINDRINTSSGPKDRAQNRIAMGTKINR
ncbi:MAG: hypothetical protein LUQ22_03240, partial [Methanotrichaceae archaeon]|nr:hypothetical protein [Methanotrichaceae archaeon]